jgi:hypothetical protein
VIKLRRSRATDAVGLESRSWGLKDGLSILSRANEVWHN